MATDKGCSSYGLGVDLRCLDLRLISDLPARYALLTGKLALTRHVSSGCCSPQGRSEADARRSAAARVNLVALEAQRQRHPVAVNAAAWAAAAAGAGPTTDGLDGPRLLRATGAQAPARAVACAVTVSACSHSDAVGASKATSRSCSTAVPTVPAARSAATDTRAASAGGKRQAPAEIDGNATRRDPTSTARSSAAAYVAASTGSDSGPA